MKKLLALILVLVLCLPAMALAALCIHLRDLVRLIRRPASSFLKGDEEG